MEKKIEKLIDVMKNHKFGVDIVQDEKADPFESFEIKGGWESPIVKFIQKELMYGAYGFSFGNDGKISKDLLHSINVKNIQIGRYSSLRNYPEIEYEDVPEKLSFLLEQEFGSDSLLMFVAKDLKERKPEDRILGQLIIITERFDISIKGFRDQLEKKGAKIYFYEDKKQIKSYSFIDKKGDKHNISINR